MRARRSGFSLLELMIALVLLGVLSALAWSILDNFRSAEQRGWKVASRLQTVRSARLWLEEDLLHVDEPIKNPRDQTPLISSLISFSGDSAGFKVQYTSSIDPLPWLEELIVQSGDSTSKDAPALNSYTRLGLFPVEATYRIQSGKSLTREVRSLAPSSPTSNNAELVEPTLTVNDLYRRSDREAETLSATSALNSSRLEPIYRARFRYHDGTAWKSSWSGGSSKLPRAIELAFDLDQPTSESNETATDENNRSSVDETNLSDPTAEVEEPIVELDDDVAEAMLQEPRQVRVVVRLPWVTAASESSDSDTSSNNSPDTFIENAIDDRDPASPDESMGDDP